jgi:hypothetical protein
MGPTSAHAGSTEPGPPGHTGERILNMKRIFVLFVIVLSTGGLLASQDKATVETPASGPFHPGGPIVFNVKLNEPLPKGAHFDFRISSLSADEEISLGSGEPIGSAQKDFRIAGTLPEGALPGEWHISVIWLFLPGSGWTHNQIAPNDLRFKVEGKPYPIPTKAAVTVAH